ncbi:MAG TPA: GlsB/YeaQ/YmgE family stress response membrane protein [Allosphingosinicella sp.]|uniref:GlsB/YeaQ/YmgE family stress response membrane protein n=1 Tax=Allosphingosinicella sp. TaxID=2823234 RepID=UPI002ED86EED
MLEGYSILGWIVVGGLAGALAKFIMPGRDPGGCIVTILLGVAGALVAGFIGKAVGWYDEGDGAGFIAAVLGALLILLVYRLLVRRR